MPLSRFTVEGRMKTSSTKAAAIVALAMWFFAACGGGTMALPTQPKAADTPPPAPAPAPPGALNGTFELTFAANPACTMLPTVARTRTYLADGGGTMMSLRTGAFGPVAPGPYQWNVIYTQALENSSARLWFNDPDLGTPGRARIPRVLRRS